MFPINCLTALTLIAAAAVAQDVRSQAQPTLPASPQSIWPASTFEVLAIFAQPLAPSSIQDLVGQSIRYDRETTSPSPNQSGLLPIAHAELFDDGHTLLLVTNPHPRSTSYQLRLPGIKPLEYTLSGVQAEWSREDDPAGHPRITIWLPDAQSQSLETLAQISHPHQRLLDQLKKPGILTLTGQLQTPAGKGWLRLRSSGVIEEASFGDVAAEPADPGVPKPRRTLELECSSTGEPTFCLLSIRTGQAPFRLAAEWLKDGAQAGIPLTRDRWILPWAPSPAPTQAATTPLPDLKDGDPARGRTLFFSDQAQCSRCHTHSGKGGSVGPDLSHLRFRDPAWVYQSIANPSQEIEPEFTTYTIVLKNGQVLTGLVHTLNGITIRVVDSNAKTTDVARSQIVQVRASATSVMPVGLAAALGETAVRDLIAFLLSDSKSIPSATRHRRMQHDGHSAPQ